MDELAYTPVSAYNSNYETISKTADYIPVIVVDQTDQTNKIRNALITHNVDDILEIGNVRIYDDIVACNMAGVFTFYLNVDTSAVIQQFDLQQASRTLNRPYLVQLYYNNNLIYEWDNQDTSSSGQILNNVPYVAGLTERSGSEYKVVVSPYVAGAWTVNLQSYRVVRNVNQ